MKRDNSETEMKNSLLTHFGAPKSSKISFLSQYPMIVYIRVTL